MAASSGRGRPSGDRRGGRSGGGDRRNGTGGRRPSGGRGGTRGSGDGRSPGRGSDRSGDQPGSGARRPKTPLTVQKGAPLPRWVREEIVRSTPKDRRDLALQELSVGLEAFAEERYKRAAAALRKAKQLAPRAATVREILGLSAYRSGGWDEALKELRAFRRLTGETTHMPVEMDCLRALDRPDDAVAKTWELYQELDSSRDTDDEMRVVYASHLLDRGDVAGAWRIIKPGRLINNAPEPVIRRWAVAARVAIAAGDSETAKRLVEAIRAQSPDVEWLEELEELLG